LIKIYQILNKKEELSDFEETRRKMNSKRIYSFLKLQSQTKWLFRHNSTKLSKPKLKFGANDPDRKVTFGEYCLLIIPASAFGLGVWQVQRRAWKLELLKDLEDRTTAEPVPLPFDQESLSSLEYCKVFARGEFEHDKIVYIGPRSLFKDGNASASGGLFGNSDGIGFHVITPFKLENSEDRILVNRGWVPRNKTSASSRGEIVPTGNIDLIGKVRMTERGSQNFMPKNAENTNKWNTRDVEALAKKFDTLPIFLDADHSCSVTNGPIGGQTRCTLSNDHMSYLITWFSLSAATSFLWFKKYVIR